MSDEREEDMSADILYGFEDTERLHGDPEDLLEEVFDDVNESFGAIADRMAWPLVIYPYRRIDLAKNGEAQRIADRIIRIEYDWLDEEYSDPDGDCTEPTEAVKAAALAFAEAVVRDYVPWACELAADLDPILYRREEVRKLFGEETAC